VPRWRRAERLVVRPRHAAVVVADHNVRTRKGRVVGSRADLDPGRHHQLGVDDCRQQRVVVALECAKGLEERGHGAPISPPPALLTSASTGPARSTARAMLSASVTSSGSMRDYSQAGSKSSRGLRMVAMTAQPRSRNILAVSGPKPDEAPVMRMVFMSSR
jgi:hypothetical protein